MNTEMGSGFNGSKESPLLAKLPKELVKAIRENHESAINLLSRLLGFTRCDNYSGSELLSEDVNAKLEWISVMFSTMFSDCDLEAGRNFLKLIRRFLKINLSPLKESKLFTYSIIEILQGYIRNNTKKLKSQSEINDTDELLKQFKWSEVIQETLRIITLLLSESVLTETDRSLGQIVSFVGSFLFYNLPDCDIRSMLENSFVYPSSLSQYFTEGTVNSTNGLKNKRKQRLRRRARKNSDEDEGNLEGHFRTLNLKSDYSSGKEFTSESEVSASDVAKRDLLHLETFYKSATTKVRLLAFRCMDYVYKYADKRAFLGYWSSFIPGSDFMITQSYISSARFNLLKSICCDTSGKVRLAACYLLNEMLTASGHIVVKLAEESTKNQSKHPFTSVSQMMASMVNEMHACIQYVLNHEKETPVLLQALKFGCTLIAVSPYNKLKNGLLTQLLNECLKLLKISDSHVKALCTCLLTTSLSVKQKPKYFYDWFAENGKALIDFAVNSCLIKSARKETDNISDESVKLVTSILLVDAHINTNTSELLELGLTLANTKTCKSNPVVQNLVSKYLHSLLLGITSNKRSNLLSIENIKLQSWWTEFFKSLLFTEYENDSTVFQESTMCILTDLLSLLQDDTFDKLDKHLQYHLITLLLGKAYIGNKTTSDNSFHLNGCLIDQKASIIHCIGVYTEFNTMLDDINFLMDVNLLCTSYFASIEVPGSKEILHLLNQVCWTFANLNDTLFKVHLDHEDVTTDFVLNNLSVVQQVFALPFSHSIGDNVKVNCIRSIRSLVLLLLAPSRLNNLDHKSKALISLISLNLVICLRKITCYKLQWNICLAFAEFFSNINYLNLLSTSNTKQPDDLNELVSYLQDFLVQTSENHKVNVFCFQAVSSIACFEKLSAVDNTFNILCQFVLKNYCLVSPTYIDTWLEKVIKGLIHFCTILTKRKSCVRPDEPLYETLTSLIDLLSSVNYTNADCLIHMFQNLLA